MSHQAKALSGKTIQKASPGKQETPESRVRRLVRKTVTIVEEESKTPDKPFDDGSPYVAHLAPWIFMYLLEHDQ